MIGWNPVAAMPPDQLAQMIQGVKEMAAQAGRDPAEIKIAARANLTLTEAPAGADRRPFNGSPDVIKSDIEAVRKIGVDELFLDPLFSPAGATLDQFLKSME